MNRLAVGLGIALCWAGWIVSATGADTLIARGAVWKYLDNGSDQGVAWRAPGFDDSSWASGPAELGYGEGDENTVVNGGPSNNRFPTTYFRRSFTAVNPAGYTVVRFQVKRDDGVVVYLNGVEIYRNNLGNGPVAFDTFAQNAGDDGQNFLAPVAVDPALLLNGANLLAAEIHQSDSGSSDISFDFEMTASRENFAPTVELTSPPSGRTFTAPADIALRATATDAEGNLAGVEFYAANQLQGTDTSSPYTFQWSGVPIGTYAIYAVGFDTLGARGTSVVATVSVVPSSPPVVTGRNPLPGAVNALNQITVSFSGTFRACARVIY
jgi:hypothetical protein